MIRGAFIRAAKGLEAKGKPLSTLIAKELEERPLDTLRAIAGFVPKEMLLEASIRDQTDELSDEALNAEIKRLAAATGALLAAAGESEATTH
jgi:hypothetical protein